jgi:hypothetical protein
LRMVEKRVADKKLKCSGGGLVRNDKDQLMTVLFLVSLTACQIWAGSVK